MEWSRDHQVNRPFNALLVELGLIEALECAGSIFGPFLAVFGHFLAQNDQNLNSFLLLDLAHQIASIFSAELKSAIHFGIYEPIWMLGCSTDA